jgi:SAM-dependent methyltransferase
MSRDLRGIRGLKYPDEFLARFFFKRRHDRRAGSVVELGCGNGSNLALYLAHGWDAIGIDISAQAIADAEHNLQGSCRFIRHDLANGLPELTRPLDVLLMPSSLYYLPRTSVVTCLRQLRGLAAPAADFYLRMRLIDDYRYGRGSEVERNGFRLSIDETGERDCLNVFYTEHELHAFVLEELGADPRDLVVLRSRFDNLQNGRIIPNSDLILWGRLS